MATSQPASNPLKYLERYGQSVWLDAFRRGWVASGELGRLIEEDGVRGVTINPTIFEKAVSGSTDYDETIRRLFEEGLDARAVYDRLVAEDVQIAADLFRPVYDRTGGADGFVSIELPPAFAYDTEASVREAKRLHKLIDRENIMIKVPGTLEGAMAIEELTYDGINVNVTLLFSIDDYERVAYAYIRGLEHRLREGRLLGRISSVASFFVSRIDAAVDHRLEELLALPENDTRKSELQSLIGKTAIANAKMAYQRFKAIFYNERFVALGMHGAREQLVLWASTSTKNPKYKDVYYVEGLIGPRTVDTIPLQTLFAFRNHGEVRPTLEEDLNEAKDVLKRIAEAGIDLGAVTQKLQEDGVNTFQKSSDELMECLDAKQEAVASNTVDSQILRIGDYQSRVDYALAALSEQAFSRRLWEKDPSLWKQGPDGEKVINNRLGWLDIVGTMVERAPEINEFVAGAKDAGFKHAVLMGMGGSSLSPEVSRLTFGEKDGYPTLMVLDSTVPAAVLDIERTIDPAKTIFIVSTKSGTTVETLSAYKYFFEKVQAQKGEKASENFVAITDPGTPLEAEAKEKNFRKVFINFGDIGGRYSALSYFGLVPAALIGVDIDKLLLRAGRMVEASASCVQPADNPGVILGTVIAELALEGRTKMTLITSPELSSFGYWVEQLVAESTGKNGIGVTPVESEPIGSPDSYGDDRLFVYMRLASDTTTALDLDVKSLEAAGQPVVEIHMSDKYDLGQEYYRWEIATGAACALLGVNSFDEPNVKESKDNTNRFLAEFKEKGKLPEEKPVLEEAGIKLYCDEETKSVLDKIRTSGPHMGDTLLSYISAHLNQFQPGNYFALMAFVNYSKETDKLVQCMRGHLSNAYGAATTFGYGPRFLHSTGQLHKGGPNSGVFIQFTADDMEDVKIPEEIFSFSVLKSAQAMGDEISLRNWGRRLIRLHLGHDVVTEMSKVLDIINEAVKEQPE